MATEMILIREYCHHYHTSEAFLEELALSGLIRLAGSGSGRCIPYEELPLLESYTRWFHELDINIAGIEALQHLLEKVQQQQQRIRQLEERLRRYEAPAG